MGNKNKRSIVLKIDPFNVILPGDATGTTTKELLKKYPILPTGILVAAHHGTDTERCNNEEFLHALSPNCILASAAGHSKTKHPSGKFIQRALTHLALKPKVLPHTVTFHNKGADLDATYYKPFLTYDNGYTTAVTEYALYTTIDMGDIRIEQGDNNNLLLSFPNTWPFEATPKTCMLKSINRAPLSCVTIIDLTQSDINDSDITTIETLPTTLQQIYLDKNPITIASIIHLISLLKEHPSKIGISFKDVAITFNQIEYTFKNNLSIIALLKKWLFHCALHCNNIYNRTETLWFQILIMRKDTAKDPMHGFYLPQYMFPWVKEVTTNFHFPATNYLPGLQKVRIEE